MLASADVRRGYAVVCAPGATLIQQVYPKSPAQAAGLAPGDIVLGPPGHPFGSQRQLREWTMVSPRGVPLPLEILRPGTAGSADTRLELALTLHPYPLELPQLPGPPKIGQPAPDFPATLKPLASSALPVLADVHLLFFWATWCGPCRLATPEVMAFAAARGMPVLAITDEDPDTVVTYLDKRKQPFFAQVATDNLRESFIAHGVSGTPTIVLVDADGVISQRQVGYRVKTGLQVDGWSWTQP